MPRLRLVQVRKDRPVREHVAGYRNDQADEILFGWPPSLVAGCLTGLVGAMAGSVSLLVYFLVLEPLSHFSRDWLLFLIVGAAAGYFLRVEQHLLRVIQAFQSSRP